MRFEEDIEKFADTVTDLARDLIAPRSLSETLNRITQLAVDTLAGCDHAGVLLVRPGRRVEAVASTSQLVEGSDKAQGDLGEGPCFDAAREGRSYRVVDMRTETRWPRYAPAARELGIGAMMGFQLFAEPDSLAALDLYSEEPYTLTPKSQQLAWLFASHAAVAIAGSRGGDELRIEG
ncbi:MULTISPECIES: GAF domain-containing protein [Saccharopolyspora]|uniref:GAF domain-containing protein n=1 Tax=Saccharopolyspora cebuensis TaxID=418759 RepID=A0ABV4CMT7_9PSEU